MVDRAQFDTAVRRTGAAARTKGFSCWDQFVAMSFCQLAQAKSLREIEEGLACCEGRLRHLGIEAAPARTHHRIEPSLSPGRSEGVTY